MKPLHAITVSWILCAVSLAWPTLSRAAAGAAPSQAAALRLYVGTYTGPKSKGIYTLELDPATGALTAPELAAETSNPTFLALHPSGNFLFAINEIQQYDGKTAGSVSGFAIDTKSGKLTPINQRTSGGPGPCHLSFDPSGKHVLAGNYVGGSFEVLPVAADGQLGEPSCFIQDDKSDPKRQPHGHFIQLDPAGKFVLADDLGLDRIFVYHFDPGSGRLSPNDPPFAETLRGAGPRHLAFHPDGKTVYNINELNSTMSVYSYDASRGALTEVQTLPTLPSDFQGHNSCAEVQVHPNGHFVYGSNRGHDSIALFKVDEATGKLTAGGYFPSGGKSPRNFAIDPTGAWLLAANQDTGNIVVFHIDPESGALKETGHSVEISSPVCITFVPSIK